MLPREYRLKKRNDFQVVFQQGRTYQEDFLKIKFIRNKKQINRFGIVVGLKISKKAVVRNKIRRRLQEIIRINFNRFRLGFDIVIFPTSQIIGKKYQEIEDVSIKLFKKAGLLINN